MSPAVAANRTLLRESTQVDRPGRPAPKRTERVFAVWVGLAVLLAAVVRLSRLDLVEFKADEASALRMAEDMVRLGHVPEAGMMSSQGILAPPHLSYVLAPAVALSRDPAFVSGAVALANVAAVVGVGWLARRWFGGLAAGVATLLYAVNPWAVFWSRKIWPPDLLPPLALLLFVLLMQRRASWNALAYPVLALGTMIHFSFAVLAPMLLLPTLRLLRQRRWASLALGGAAALLVLLPFLLHEQRIGWLDYPTLRYELSRHPTRLDAQGLALALGLITGLGASTLAGVPVSDLAPAPVLLGAAWLEAGLLVLALGLGFARLSGRLTTPGLTRQRLLALVVWIALPILFTLRHAFDLHDHYYLLLYPAPFILIGAAFGWLVSRRAAWARPVLACSLAAVVGIASGQVATVASMFPDLAGAYEACYDLPLASSQRVAQDAVDFGRNLGATRATVELDEADAMPIAYLLRPQYPHLEMQRYGDLGLGAASAPSAEPSAAGDVLGVWTAPDPIPDWRPRLALVWTPPAQPVHWQLASDTGQTFSGVAHTPEAAGERMLSWFTFEVPREAAAGAHTVRLSLLDDATGATLAETSQSIRVNASPRCVA